MEMKQAAAELLESASSLEQEALLALREAAGDDRPDPVPAKEMSKCQGEIAKSISKETQAGQFIEQSLAILQSLLERLMPPAQETPAR